MAETKYNAEDIGAAIMEALGEYQGEITSLVKKEAIKAARQCRQDIAKDSPENEKLPGPKYKDAWRSEVTSEDAFSLTCTVHNKQPQLTHLLENGHALRQGGRSPAIVHIAPNEEKARNDFAKKCEGIIRNGH